MGKIYERDGRYGIDFRDHRGKRVRRVVSSDKGVAAKFLGDALLAAEKLKAGLIGCDPAEAKRPIQQHIDAYCHDLRRRGRDDMYVYIISRRLEATSCTPTSAQSVSLRQSLLAIR